MLGIIVITLSVVYLIGVSQRNQLEALPANTFTGGSIPGNSSVGSNGKQFSDIQQCQSGPGNVSKCYDNFIASYSGAKTVKQILADLETSRSLSPTLESGCHPIAHAIGRFAYTKTQNVGDAFEQCDFTCHSGCYHGVMERMFYTPAQLAAGIEHLSYKDLESKIPGICAAEKFSNPTRQIIFQCLHGLGHAILYTINYDLDTGLKLCDLLPTSYERSSCHGGLIMENVTAFDKSKRDLKRDQPLYPCTRLDNDYKDSCFAMQTSVMFEYGMSEEQIASECRNAGNYQSTCFKSLGRDLSNRVRTGDGAGVAKICESAPPSYRRECIRGSIYALIDNTWDGKYAFHFCTILTADNKADCYTDASFYMLNAHEKTISQVLGDCDKFTGTEANSCKQAAQSAQ